MTKLEPEDFGCVAAVDCDAAENLHVVWILGREQKEWKKADRQMRARAKSLMRKFCKLGPEALNNKQLRFEKRTFNTAQDNKKLFAFKAYQLRAYGTYVLIDGVSVFVISKVDIAKKQNKANARHLDAACKRIVEFIDGLFG